MQKDHKILIFSFEPISSVLSNGRTLRNLLGCFDKSQIYNVFIHGNPDIGFANYICISDKQALRSMFFLKPKSFVLSDQKVQNVAYSEKSAYRRRSNFKLLVRELAWSSYRIKKLLYRISKEINPEVVMVFLGNGGFIMKNSALIAKKIDVPIISFNCEDYYFKNYDYISYKNKKCVFHRLYKSFFKKGFNYLMNIADACIYLTDDLKRLYDSAFPNKNSFTIYNSSLLVDEGIKPNYNSSSKTLVYAGNIALGRLEELENIGNVVRQIDPEFKVCVYTTEDREEFLAPLKNSKYLEYKGSVDYQTLLPILKESYAIIHAESSDSFFMKHTIHGFSTKIPDSLASGTCFVVKASKESSIYKYLSQNNCACYGSSLEEMTEKLRSLLSNHSVRNKYIDMAIETAQSNHSLKKNSALFKKIVDNTIDSYNCKK